MKLTQKLEKEIRTAYQAFWKNLFSVNINTLNTLLDDDFRQIATTEAEVFFTKKDALNFLKLTEDQLLGNIELRNQNIKIESLDTYFLLTDLCDGFVKINNVWDFYAKVRNTFLLHKTSDGWKFILQHTSLPDHRTEEGETVALKKIEKENLDLRDAVKRRTVEIENKNRELEIEAALERVRSRSMAMHDSSDLSEVVFAIFTELVKLDAQLDRCLILIVNPQTLAITWYLTGKEGLLSNNGFLVQNNQHPSHRAYLDGWRSKRKKWQYILAGEEKKQTDAFIFTQTQLSQLPDFIKADMKSVETIHLSISSDNFGCLIASSISPLSEAHADIVEKFTIVFNQTYTRFLDLQKAEEQTKEAHIELALERVRARAMAMHTSQELKEVALELRKQMGLLGQKDLEICAIHLYDNENWFESWNAMKAPGLEGEILQTQARFPNKGIKIVDELMIQFKKGTRDYVVVNEDEKIVEWLNVLKTHAPTIHSSIMQSIGKLPVKKLNSNWSVADFAGGALVMVTYTEPDVQSRNLLRRSANVFEQAYIRFLDLQKAEAQTKEAQIEVSLERVRATTMAMHNSEDVSNATATMFAELEKLGIENIRGGITIISPDQMQEVWSITNLEEGKTIRSIGLFDMRLHPFWREIFKGWKNKEKFQQYWLGGKDKEDYIQLLNATPNYLSQPIKEIPDVYIQSYFFGEGAVWANSIEPHSEQDKRIMKRFASVFSLTFRRYQDLQKAEAQTREAQIQLALERVRARTMAMQQSAELPEAANLLFKQVQSLDMPAWSAGYCIWDDDKQGITLWMSSEGVMQPSFHAPLTKDPSFIHMREAYEKGDPFHVEEVGGKALVKHYTYMRTLPVVGDVLDSIIEAGHPLPTFQIFHCVYFSQGFLLFITYEPVPKAHDIFKRFGKVFDQTYTRFLDLQKAEAQARESQIQLAMERVRARTMAMQHSSELGETSALLFQQIETLGVPPWSCGFNIWEQGDTVFTSYMGSPDGASLDGIKIPLHEEATFIHFQECRERGDKLFVDVLEGETLEAHYRYFLTLPGIKEAFEKRALTGEHLPTFQINHLANFSHGNLMFITYEPCPEAHDIFIRFAQVFEQTYTRFLDLQKAEAQAREAQIEAALERVRSRSMAMHKSEEFPDVIQVVFEQFQQLDFKIDSAQFDVSFRETDDLNLWAAVPGQPYPAKLHIPYADNAVFNSIKKAKKEGHDFVFFQFTKEQKNEFFNYFFLQVPNIPEERKKLILSSPGMVRSAILLDNVSLAIQNYSGIPYSDAEHVILRRFAKAFEQIYTRFLDLQKAEEQAREAQIEAALEKVRSRSLAMQNSEELVEVAELLRKEMGNLGVEELETSSIYLVDKKNEQAACWYAIKDIRDGNKKLLSDEMTLLLHDTWVGKEMWKFYQSEKEQASIVMKGPTRKEWINYCASQSQGLQGYYGSEIPERTYHLVKFNGGYIGAASPGDISTESWDLLKRAAAVFSFAYTRFKDLQDAAARARETQIELALERVRARTMAMHNSDDVGETVATLFNEFEKLGIHTHRCGILIISKESMLAEVWTAKSNLSSKANLIIGHLDLTMHPLLQDLYHAWKRKEPVFNYTMIGDDLKSYYQAINNTKYYPTQFDLDALPAKEFYTDFYFSEGCIFAFTPENIAEEATSIFKRFANVFGQTYRRYLDLQKAEAQAKEAQIEAALERVRSRTMAMQKSEELREVVCDFFNQMYPLGFAQWGFALMLVDEAQQGFNFWLSAPNGRILPESYYLPKLEHRASELLWSAYSNQLPVSYLELKDEEKLSWDLLLFEKSGFAKFPDSVKEEMLAIPYVMGTLVSMRYGLMEAIDVNPLPEELVTILQRFAKVFEQTYTRFLDLEKAEAQGREAKVQLALERVRARTMAMQKSEELAEVSYLLNKQVVELGIPTWGCAFNIYNENDSTEWFSNLEGTIPAYHTPRENIFLKYYEAGQRGESLLIEEFAGERIKELYKYFASLNDSENETITEHVAKAPDYQINHMAYFKYGYLLFVTFVPAPEAHDIFKRFAKEFEQTYTRFLDLQKAEAQAREAQIQLSLERIRAKAMAMQHSDELSDFLTVVFEQFDVLNLSPVNCHLSFFDLDNNRITFRLTGKKGATLIASQEIDMDASPLWKQKVDDWKSGNFKDVDVLYTPFENLPEIGEIFKEILSKLPEDDLPLPEDYPNGQYVTEGYYKYGYLGYSASQPASDEEKEITRRIANEFGNVYQRFLDLQKAEAQARESQIQLALERVRARTMAMQRSEELPEVAALLFQQVKTLGVPQIHCGFNIFEIDEKECTWYPGSPDGDILPPCKIPLTEHPIFMNFIESRKRGDELFVYEKEGEYQAGHYRYMLSLPVLGEILQNMLDAGIPFPTFQIDHLANFSHGNLLFITSEHFPEMHNTFKRFAKVFEQTYTRFLDLQKAELSAQEAIKQSSLDRVRGEIASMRTADDLSRITPVVWHELTALGVPFFRCGVFIIKEKEQLVHVYLSNPEGKSLAVLHLPMDGVELTIHTVDHWRRQQTYTAHWDREQFMAWVHTMQTQGQVQSATTYQGAESPPESLTLQFIPFNQGMLYIGSTDALNEDQLSLAKDLAAAFSVAYARYEDFKTIENTLAELKATQSQLIQSEKMASLGELTAGIAHEIQNPLNFVNNFSEVSNELIAEVFEERKKEPGIRDIELEEELLGDIKENLSKINHHGKRASDIVKGMLEHSRKSSGTKEPTNINALVDENMRLAYHGLRAKYKDFYATMETHFESNLPKVDVLSQDMGRVLLNLFTNAFYAVNERSKKEKAGFEPTVSIRTKRVLALSGDGDEHSKNGNIQISITDNGSGIPDAIKDKIFQPFFTTKPTGQGTGLGLSLAYDIVTKGHGGTLEVNSTEGIGSEFIVTLPFKTIG